MSAGGRSALKTRRQNQVIEAISKGATLAGAAAIAGVSTSAINAWRSREPRFSAEYEVARGRVPAAILKAQQASGVPDFLEWREAHCAYLDPRSGDVHRATNSWFQADAYAKLQQHRRLIMVLPPGHLKTTLFGIEHSTWAIQRDRNVRITVIEKNEEEAAKVVGAVQQRLSDSDYYEFLAARLKDQREKVIVDPIKAYGGLMGYKPKAYRSKDSWGAHGFRVLATTSGEKDYTMQAKGAGSQIQGIRSDIIKLDDIQDPREISPLNTDKLMDWFHRVILGRIYDWQQLVVLGNLFHPTDFMNALIAAHPDWPVIRYPAIKDGKPLCPEVWTPEGLEIKEREVGSNVWFYTWMQAEGSFDDAVFKAEALEIARNSEFRLGTAPRKVTDIFIGVDPAITRYCAIVAWGLDRRTGTRYLIDVFNEKGMRTWDNVMRQTVDMAARYGARTVAVEMAAQQASIANTEWFRRELRSIGARIATYQTRTETGARAEADDFDISSIGALFDEGLVVLPYGDKHSQDAVDAYCAQLLTWRPGVKHLTRDMVMATLFAEAEAREVARKAKLPQSVQPSRKYVPGWATNGEGRWPWVPRQRRKGTSIPATLP